MLQTIITAVDYVLITNDNALAEHVAHAAVADVAKQPQMRRDVDAFNPLMHKVVKMVT